MKVKPDNEMIRQSWQGSMPEGHEQRFMEKLDRTFHQENKIWRLQRYAIAASIVAFLGITALVMSGIEHYNQTGMIMSGITPELSETEHFYRAEIEQRMQQIHSVGNIDQEVFADIAEFDKAFSQIRSDFKKNPGDERLVNALLGTYQTKVSMLDEIIEKTGTQHKF